MGLLKLKCYAILKWVRCGAVRSLVGACRAVVARRADSVEILS